TPIKSGGIDTVAVLSARMKGWQTRTFLEKVCNHHRKQGSASKSGLALIFNIGRKDYLLGVDPIWQFLRAVYRLPKPPYVIGALTLFLGYLWPSLLGQPKTAPREVWPFGAKIKGPGSVRSFSGYGSRVGSAVRADGTHSTSAPRRARACCRRRSARICM